MDNKITKKRLNHMLSYEWIAIIIVMVAIVFVWELCYSFVSVKLTPGQRFRVFYDYNISAYQADGLIDILEGEKTFSYDLLELKYEQILKDSEVLYNRNLLGETDAIITDTKNTNTENPEKVINRANEIIDQYDMYSFYALTIDAEVYIDSFKTNGVFDDQKIEQNFRARMKGDNRFRTEAQILDGIKSEKERLTKLEKDLLTVQKLFDFDARRKAEGKESIFYSYTRYSQSLQNAKNDQVKEYYENLIENESEKNYGLKLWLLTGGERNSANYFNAIFNAQVSAEGVILMIFDIESFQTDLQYETVSFIATIVREFSNIDG